MVSVIITVITYLHRRYWRNLFDAFCECFFTGNSFWWRRIVDSACVNLNFTFIFQFSSFPFILLFFFFSSLLCVCFVNIHTLPGMVPPRRLVCVKYCALASVAAKIGYEIEIPTLGTVVPMPSIHDGRTANKALYSIES